MCSLYQLYLNMSISKLSFSCRYFTKIIFLLCLCKIFSLFILSLYNRKKKDITKMTGRMLMGLHFIFGAAGTGKTRRCCEEIRDYVTGKKGAPPFSSCLIRRHIPQNVCWRIFSRATVLLMPRSAVFRVLPTAFLMSSAPLCKMLFLRWASRLSSAASLRNTGTSCKCS